MIKLLVFALVAASLCASTSARVIKANLTTFDDVIKSDALVIVEFYAPTCSHCKILAPEWAKAAKQLLGTATLAKVDAVTEKELAKKHHVTGFPTIEIYENGRMTGHYDGERKADAIVQFAKNRLTSSPMTDVTTPEALKELKEKKEIVLLLHVDNKEDATFKTVEKFARPYRDEFGFGVVLNAGLYDGNAPGSLVMHKQFEEGKATFTGDLTDEKAVEAWVKAESFKLIDEVTEKNFQKYSERGLPLGWLMIDPQTEEESKEAIELFTEVAKLFKGKLSFIYIDGQKHAKLAEQLGHTGKKLPVFALDSRDGKYFAFPDMVKLKNNEKTIQTIKEYCEMFFEGTLDRSVRSQNVPEQQNVNGLWTAVGKTFETIVLNKKKDVLVSLCAARSEDCQRFTSGAYAALAGALKDVETLTIAEIDVLENDMAGDFMNVSLTKVPTLFFIPAGKDKIMFEGEPTGANLLRFMKGNATHPISLDENDEAIAEMNAQLLASAESIETFKKDNKAAWILFTESKKTKEFEAYNQRAKKYAGKHRFGVVVDSALFDGNKAGSTVVFQQFDDGKSVYAGDLADEKAFDEWVVAEAMPLVGEMTQDNHHIYYTRGLPLAGLFVDIEKKEATEAAKEAVASVAKQYKGKISFAWLNGPKVPGAAKRFTFSATVWPVFVLDDMEKKAQYTIPEGDAITKESLTAFFEKYMAGALEKTMKTAPIPERPTVRGLTTVVARNFEDVVLKSGKDVLFRYYSSKCPMCKHQSPHYVRVAAATKHIRSLIVAEMEEETNEAHEKFPMDEYPTLYFLPAGATEPLLYDGDKSSAEDILAYVKQHAKNPVKVDNSDLKSPKNHVEELDSKDAIAAFVKEAAIGTVLYTDKNKPEMLKAFDAFAKSMKGAFEFGVVSDPALFDGNAKGSVVLHKQLEGSKTTFKGDVTAKEFKQWMYVEAFPILSPVTHENHQTFVDRGFPMAWILVNSSDRAAITPALEAIWPVAATYKKKISFIHYNAARDKDLLDLFDFSGKKFPLFGIEDVAKDKFYAMPEDEEMTAETVLEFTESYLEGTLSAVVPKPRKESSDEEEDQQDDEGDVEESASEEL